MAQQRHARFASIEGLRPQHLPIAGEIWLDEVAKASWTTREAIKLASYIARYMVKPESAPMSMAAIEGQLQLSPEQTKVTLKLMLMFGAFESMSVIKDDVRCALNLSLLQKLRVLETYQRLEAALAALGPEECAQASWSPTEMVLVEAATETVAPAAAA